MWVLDGPVYFNRPVPRVARGAEVPAHVLHGVRAGDPVADCRVNSAISWGSTPPTQPTPSRSLSRALR